MELCVQGEICSSLIDQYRSSRVIAAISSQMARERISVNREQDGIGTAAHSIRIIDARWLFRFRCDYHAIDSSISLCFHDHINYGINFEEN